MMTSKVSLRWRVVNVCREELESGVTFAGEADHLLGEIDSHSTLGLKTRKQVAASATQFEYALVTRNQERVYLDEAVPVSRAEVSPTGPALCDRVPVGPPLLCINTKGLSCSTVTSHRILG